MFGTEIQGTLKDEIHLHAKSTFLQNKNILAEI